MKFSLQHICAFGLVACLGLLSACQTAPVPPEVARNLASIRNEVEKGRTATIETTARLRSLRDAKPNDLKVMYSAYDASVKSLESKALGVGLVMDFSQDRSDQYFGKWEKDIAQLAEDDTRSRAADRRAEAQASYRDIKSRVADLRVNFRAFMATLKDIHKMVGADTTPAGVKAAQPTIDAVLEREKLVLKDIDALIAAINKVQP